MYFNILTILLKCFNENAQNVCWLFHFDGGINFENFYSNDECYFVDI